jgi:hypothetical protein
MGRLTAIGKPFGSGKAAQCHNSTRTIPRRWGYQEERGNSMQRIYLGIAFLGVMGLVFASLVALDRMIGG